MRALMLMWVGVMLSGCLGDYPEYEEPAAEAERARLAAEAEAERQEPRAGGTDASTTAGTEGGTMVAGTEGGTMVAGTDAPMGDCDTSCGAFAQCAVDSCTGYDESRFDVLKEDCMETCTPAFAAILDSKETCEDKIDFVSGVKPDFRPFCDSTTGGFCETLTATCGGWANMNVTCADWYNAAPTGEVDATEGASQACYQYHLSAAMGTMDIETHCPHARGEIVCVD